MLLQGEHCCGVHLFVWQKLNETVRSDNFLQHIWIFAAYFYTFYLNIDSEQDLGDKVQNLIFWIHYLCGIIFTSTWHGLPLK